MQFFSLKKIQSAPKNANRPFATLRHDSWDDFGYRTLFDLHFYPESGDSIEIGPVKIARTGVIKRTELPDRFTELGDEYFSLGQSMEYYQTIRNLPKAVHRKLLLGLRDIVYNPAIEPSQLSPDVFATSLLRISQAAKVLQEAGRLFRIDAPEPTGACSFMFTVKLNEAVSAHELAVRLGDNPKIPDRIMALIGKNGTGKTWLLGRLAAALSGDEVGVGMFEPERPGFERVIAVSYSAFDRFNKPTKKRTFSYVYCGIYDSEGKINSRVKLLRKAREAAQTIVARNRRELWQDLIRNVMEDAATDAMKEYIFGRGDVESPVKVRPPKLSSGQLVLVSTITELLAAIEDDSIVLFDEPELHQHPNAIAGLMVSLTKLLKRFSSYAIIATHSPLVIQQIPSAYVRLFIRSGNATVIHEPVSECFGENLTTITQEVFQTNSSPSLYREWLRAACSSLDDDELDGLFPKGLSFNAKSVMESLK